MSTFNLDPAEFATIASAAIFDRLSQQARDDVIQQAIQFLLTPEKDRNRYGYGKTPLQQAFDTAINNACMKVVQEEISNNEEIKAQIRGLLGPLLMPALEASADKHDYRLSEKLGQAIGNWLAEVAREA